MYADMSSKRLRVLHFRSTTRYQPLSVMSLTSGNCNSVAIFHSVKSLAIHNQGSI